MRPSRKTKNIAKWILLGTLLNTGFNNCGPAVHNENSFSSSSSSSVDLSDGLDGKTVYQQKCLSCHGAFEGSPKFGRSADQIENAIATVPQMASLQLNRSELAAIVKAWTTEANSDGPKFKCENKDIRGSSEKGLRRLSYIEFVNTLRDLVGAPAVANAPSLNRFPSDSLQQSVDEFTNAHTLQHVEAIVDISIEVAQYLSANKSELAKISPTCLVTELNAGAVSEACLKQFITAFGRRALRRPLTSAEIQSYVDVYNKSATAISGLTVADRFGLVVSRILQAPDLHFHFETSGPLIGGVRAKVDSYSVASRLSYQLTGSLPDNALLDAAAQGNLNTLDGVRAQAQRLVNTTAGRRQFRDLISFWLRLNAVAAPAAGPTARFGVASDATTRNKLRDEAVEETLDFAEYIVFNQNGTYTDLMTSPLAFPPSANLAKIMAVPFSGAGVPVTTNNGRRGLATRPAMLLSNLERERPMHRGVVFRTRLLCDVIPPPPPNADQIAAENVTSIDTYRLSIREVASATTKNVSCQACHSQINPLGFVLGGFGTLGEKIGTEKVYNASGVLTAQFTPDTTGSNLNVNRSTDSASNEQDLIGLLAESSKAQACLPQFLFRYSKMRNEISSDNCGLSESEAIVRSNKPVKEAWIAIIANDDIFWKGQ